MKEKKKKLNKEQKHEKFQQLEVRKEEKLLQDSENLKEEVTKKYELHWKQLRPVEKAERYKSACNKKVFNPEICPHCEDENCGYSGRRN